MSALDQARRVADAVLYEGYLLYPYRASSQKNQLRWQFGVLAPRRWSEDSVGESSWMQTECLIEPGERPHLAGQLRFLRLSRRTVQTLAGETLASLEAGGTRHTAWDEGVDAEIAIQVELAPHFDQVIPFALGAEREEEPIHDAGRFVRERRPIRGELRITVLPVAAASPLWRVRIRAENLGDAPEPGATRDEALVWSMIGAHTLLVVQGGAFVSLLDPPEWAADAVAGCTNVRTWPVLVGPPGERSVVLSSPIILGDRPQIAPESPGALYDATEIDEILTLRTMTLTDEEKRQARATDPRAAAIIDRVDSLPAETLSRLHGTFRAAEAVEVAGVVLGKGSRVRLRPGARRTDAQDMFLVGQEATVRDVQVDVDGGQYLAVTLDDDPAADLKLAQRRFLYFHPDEVEPR